MGNSQHTGREQKESSGVLDHSSHIHILKLKPQPKESTNMLRSQMDGQRLFHMEGGGFEGERNTARTSGAHAVCYSVIRVNDMQVNFPKCSGVIIALVNPDYNLDPGL